MLKHPYVQVINKATKTEAAEILLYGYIGGDEVVAKDFVRELRELEKEYSLINVRINSGGGSIYEGFTIFNAIRNAKVPVDTYVDGLAASMGTVIAAAGRKRYMSKIARQMTHRASGFAFGNADDLRGCADMMEGLEEEIAGIYAECTGLTAAECLAKYIKTGSDRWVTAKQALEEKLIHGIYDSASTAPDAPKNATEKELCGSYMDLLNPQNSLQNDNLLFII